MTNEDERNIKFLVRIQDIVLTCLKDNYNRRGVLIYLDHGHVPHHEPTYDFSEIQKMQEA